ncbi:E1-E2 ATPase [Musa troglodytarum]|uniref:Magnesium-transporting ATPase, P-type 1 n=1 Tax=Musa troglodytarum TaxID=320322 RepID=A0A9E7G7D9_9LILI|nr:E1-E2 ATPase [Musa troglodytarum]
MDAPVSIGQSLMGKHLHRSNEKYNVLRAFSSHFRKLLVGKENNAGPRSEAEERVHSWIQALARSEKSLTFEYVQSTERGLSFKEAEMRLLEGGQNIPIDHNFPSWWQLWCNAFIHPFNIILIIMATLSFLASDNANGIIMLILVMLSVGIRFHQDYNSSRAAMKLSELLRSQIRVQRCAGKVIQTELVVQIDYRDIVPGDIIHFSPGDLFPGDVRLLTSKDLIVSQSSLTGESGTTEKVADMIEDPSTPLLELKNVCFMGTSVVSGCGTGLVISTGSRTYMSTIFSTMGQEKHTDAFENGLRCVSYALVCIMVLVVPIISLSDYYASHNLGESVIFGISVAVALTPQMLPLIVNTNLAKGAITMAKDRCIVKRLSTIQHMGAMDILCIDKTGTLTTNRIIMVHHMDSWGFPNERVLRFAFLNSYFKTEANSPIDDAILAYAYTNGYRFQASKWRMIEEIPFDFVRRRMSVIIERDLDSIWDEQGSYFDTTKYVITKGALEEVLSISTLIEDVDKGVNLTLTPKDREVVLQKSEELSNDGLRVLGVAMKRANTIIKSGPTKYSALESDMVFLGLISFYDPPKNSAKQALWQLAEKGVKAKVLTGDSLSLAIKVCKEVGIRTTHVTTGPDLDILEHTEFHEAVRRATVLAHLTPTQKLRVVQSLQKVGNHVVGFLGDGINDSLALEAADVGISVDSGASVAKDLADIILLEKDLNVLVSGVEHGRLTNGNTMKYIKMSLVANIGSIISLFIATMFIQFEPLSPRQLLTQNFLYNLGQIAIPWDKVDDRYAKVPQGWSATELPVFILWNGPVCSIFDIGTFLFLRFYYEADQVSDSEFFHSAWFIEGLLMQALIIHMIRTEKIPFIQDMASWPVVFSTITISAVGIMIPFSPIGKLMGLMNLPLSYFGFLVVLFLGYFSLGQVVKRIYILIYKRWL